MLLLGTAIPIALGRTRNKIQLRDTSGARICTLEREDVDRYITAGYEVHGEKRRVNYLCPPRPPEAKPLPDLPFQYCWRTKDAAVINDHKSQFSTGFGELGLRRNWIPPADWDPNAVDSSL